MLRKTKKAISLYQKGISLLEVFLSLSIIAVILIMATRYFFVASTRNKINVTVSQVGGVIAATDMWRGIPGDTLDNLSIPSLYNAGLLVNFPGLKVTGEGSSSAELYTMWGNQITVSSADNEAQISIPVPDANICIALTQAYPPLDGSAASNECSSSKPYTFTYKFN